MKSIMMASASRTKDIMLTLAQLSPIAASSWVTDAETGWYATTQASYSAGLYPNGGYRVAPMTGVDLSKIKRFSAKFTMYYNTPANSIAFNIFRLTLSTGATVLVGVYDQNTDSTSGLWTFNGVTTGTNVKNTNIVDMELGYTVPDGVTITKIEWCSTSYSNFARAKNGAKEVKVTMK